MKRDFLSTSEIKLAYIDYGGEGPGLLLLHGLMGRATTWNETAAWLKSNFHVVALDQRGHGLSDKPDQAYSREHYIADTAAVIEALGLGPALIIGHSMGALNAWTLAAARPDLVKGLILEDMTAQTDSMDHQSDWKKWFATWPVPFSSLADVRSFFGAQRSSWADYFMEIMTEGPDGYRPLFSYEHMLQSVAGWENRTYWAELEAVCCPTLVVKGSESSMPRSELQKMAKSLLYGQYREVSGATHVVHYDQPAGWRAVVEPFVLEVCSHA